MIQSLSFVFPMYNELENIEKTVLLASRAGHRITDDLEIIIIDDASTDGSGELADKLTRRFPELRVIHHKENRKLGASLRTGFAAARKEWVLYIDSDLPIDFKEIRKVVPLTRHTDLITGYRISRSESLWRELMSKAYNYLIRTVFGLHVHDVNFSFKLFRRALLKKITLHSEGSFIDAEFLIQAKKCGYLPIEIGFKYLPRQAGVSTLGSWRVVVNILKEMGSYLFKVNPLPPLPVETIEVSNTNNTRREKVTSIA